MKTFFSSLSIVFILINTIYGLYEDQIGKFDWYVRGFSSTFLQDFTEHLL
jgi:hypothetical protein